MEWLFGPLSITPPTVDQFNTTGLGSSLSAHFNVGQEDALPNNEAGGGIFQDVTLNSGTLNISVDIATQSNTNNADGGEFQLLLDGVVLDSHAFGARHHFQHHYAADQLSASLSLVSAGSHED